MKGASAVAFLLLAQLALPSTANDHTNEPMGCTAIGIDGEASVSGSAFAGMNADSGSADYRLTFVPPKTHAPGSVRSVYTFNLSYPRFVGYGRGEFFHPAHPGAPLYEAVGEIPEAASTFGYYEGTEPLMNTEGLGLGESSCSSMLQNRFPGDAADARDVPVGLLDTVTLMQLALERCATARCAVEVMGSLSEKFGFVPTPGEPTVGMVKGREAYDDAGEAYTVADKTGEAWVFHVSGGVNGVTKSVWAAQKVPKGHLAVVANEFTIGDLPEEPTEDFLYSKDIFRAALAAKLWDGRGSLHFSKVFGPDCMFFEAPAGSVPIPLYASLRRWGLYDLAAPSLKLPFHTDNLDLPFSVRVEKKLTHRDVMAFMRYQYEGTEFDMTKGMLAGPFGNPYALEGGPKSGQVPRGVAISRTLYGFFAESKGQVGWFAMDTPTTSVYVPLYARASAVSQRYSTGVMTELSRDNAWWAFNVVNNFAQLNYELISKSDVYPAIEAWQDTIDREREGAEAWSEEELSAWQLSVQERVVESWWKMSDFLIMKYNDRRTNVPKVGTAWSYPQWYADLVGFDNDVHPRWVQAAAQPSRSAEEALQGGYVAPAFSLPQVFDYARSTWSYISPLQEAETALSASSAGAVSFSGAVLAQGVVTVMALCVGMVLGRTYERGRVGQKPPSSAAYAPLL